MDDRFCIAVGNVAVAALDELLAQRQMVVNFSIEYDPERAVFVRDRLMTACHIDDTEPAHADADGPVGIKTVVVGPAMGDGDTHCAQSCGACPRIFIEFENSSDAAHLLVLHRLVLHS